MDERLLKKPKVEPSPTGDADDPTTKQQLEEALIALITHQTKEVEDLTKKINFYKSQLDDAEKRLNDSKTKLARLRPSPGTEAVTGSGLSCPVHMRPRIFIPPAPPKLPSLPLCRASFRVEGSTSCSPAKRETVQPIENDPSKDHMTRKGDPIPSPPVRSQGASVRPNENGLSKDHVTRNGDPVPSPPVRSHRNNEHWKRKGQCDLIPAVGSCTSPALINFQPTTIIPSKHTRKLRSIALNPLKENMFVTSSLNGAVNLWQLRNKGTTALLLNTRTCLSPMLRRWPEDITWHPDGDRLFAAYTADSGESQISILNITSPLDEIPLFLEEKPHHKGIINCIVFMPWEDSCFATGGSDHAITIWTEREGSCAPKTIYRTEHSSAVTGVAGLHQKKMIVSVGMDRRFVGYDLLAGRSEFKHQLDSKCLTVLPNPSDFNLFMVQTGVHGKQLRLFDIRAGTAEIHAFGYRPVSSESHSSLIKPAWSPNGLHLSSGSVDPKIHIFDIRQNSATPTQSLQAHKKRVLRAEWHPSLPLIISISTDLHIGLHPLLMDGFM